MRPLASSVYQSVCALRSALPRASKYDRTTVLVSVAGAVASLVVMVRPPVRGHRDRTRRSRDVQAPLPGSSSTASLNGTSGGAGDGSSPPVAPPTAESEVPAQRTGLRTKPLHR